MARGGDPWSNTPSSFGKMLRQHILDTLECAATGLDFGEAMRPGQHLGVLLGLPSRWWSTKSER
jgi:hypothetical protein